MQLTFVDGSGGDDGVGFVGFFLILLSLSLLRLISTNFTGDFTGAVSADSGFRADNFEAGVVEAV